jgi:hypothetical protein
LTHPAKGVKLKIIECWIQEGEGTGKIALKVQRHRDTMGLEKN